MSALAQCAYQIIGEQMSSDKKVESLTTASQKIREYFKYPYDPLTTDANAYQIFRWRLNWLNPFHPNYKGVRWTFFKYFFISLSRINWGYFLPLPFLTSAS